MRNRVEYFEEGTEQRITLQIQPLLIEDAKDYAVRNGMSMSAYIRLAVIEKMEREDENK